MMDTRLPPGRYLDLVHADGERLVALADGHLDADVPACPGWRVRDVVDHIGMVYGHKIVALETGRRPEPGEWQGPPVGEDEVQWCHSLLHRLATDLGRMAPDAPAWTWWDEDQTAGFWQRRMALETVVHRVDVESAVGARTPIPDDLALDGIDEVLRIMLADAEEFDVSGPDPDPEGVRITIGPVGVRGTPEGVLLWLWGREESAHPAGAASDIDLVRRHLREATQ